MDNLIPPSYRGFFVDQWGIESEEQRLDAVRFELDGLVNSQSLGFTIDIIPRMMPFLRALEGRGEYIEALDVGSRTGVGASLIADLFMAHFSHLPTWVDTLDIDPTFQDYQRKKWQRLRNVIVGDIFDVKSNSYDYIICSHVIEHIQNPLDFVRELQRVARHYVFIYCPYNESPPISGHYTIDENVIQNIEPIEKQIFKSWWWRPKKEPDDVVFMVCSAE